MSDGYSFIQMMFGCIRSVQEVLLRLTGVTLCFVE